MVAADRTHVWAATRTMGPSELSRIGVARCLRVVVGVLLGLVCLFGGTAAAGLAVATARDALPADVSASLSSVSCPSRGFCMAVGQVGGEPSALRWSGGNWSTVSVPNTPAGADLGSVSCASSRACMAVGTYEVETSFSVSAFESFAERWNGSQWSPQTIWNEPRSAFPAADETGSELADVACSSTTSCVAVGSSGWSAEGFGGGRSRMAERWNGRLWSVTEAPRFSPSNYSAVATRLSSVSCSSARACTAVGGASTSGGVGLSFVQRLSRARWKTQKGLGSAGLVSVSCPSTVSCTAVGVKDQNATGMRELAARWNGRHWTVEPIPRLKHGAELDSVSCPTVIACVAVGNSPPPLSTGDAATPASASFNGSRWIARRTPFPPGWQALLNGVSCVSPSDCTAVGEILTLPTPPAYSQQEAALVEHWNGRKWTIQQTL